MFTSKFITLMCGLQMKVPSKNYILWHQEEIPFVSIYLIGPKVTYTASSDLGGIFEINKIRSEKYILELSSIGYYDFRDTLTINEGTAYKLIVEMGEHPGVHHD